MKRIPRADAAIALALAAAAILFWQARVIAPATVREGLFQTDFYTLLFPMYRYGFGELAQGRLPLWNPYAYGGIPFLATLYTGVLYPGNLLFLLLPTGLAMGMTAALHTFLAAFFMFLLARAWGWSRTAAGVSALTFAFTQNAVWFYGPLCFIASAAWLPLIALGIERACQGRSTRGAGLVALGSAMALFAGGLQVFVYGAYALSLFAAARLVLAARRRGPLAAMLALLWLAIGAVTAAALAAPQILPAYELAARTERAPGALSLRWADNPIVPVLPAPGAKPEAATARPPGRLAPSRALAQLSDLWTLRPRETPAFYFGILPPLLAVAALFGRRRAAALALLGGAVLAAILSTGLRTPVYALYHSLPTGAWFRNPDRFALLTGFAMAALAGLGVTAVERSSGERNVPWRAAAAAGTIGIAILALARVRVGSIAMTFAAAAAGIGALRWFGASPSGVVRAAARALLVVLLFVELALAYRNPYLHPQKDPGLLLAHANVSRFLRDRVGPDRIAIVDNEWGSFAIQRKYGVLQKIRTLNDFEPLTPRGYSRLFALLDGAPRETIAPFDGGLRLDPRRSRKPLLDLLSVRYVVVDEGLHAPWDARAAAFGLRRVPLDDREVALYENPAARPRATLISDAVVVGSEEEAAHVLADPQFDPRRVAVVQAPSAAALFRGSPALRGYTIDGWKAKGFGPAKRAPGMARIVRDEPHRVEIVATVAPRRAAWLVLMDLDYPGWRATVDGSPATIVRANLVGRSLGLSAGTHRVVFTYEAPLFRLGCLLALLFLCAWTFGALALRAHRRGMGAAGIARRVVPWVVAVGILAILIHRSGIEPIREALRGADLGLFLWASVLCTLAMYLLDLLSLSRVITWFNRPITVREVAPVKAASYVISIVNYNAGSGAIALWLRRWRGVPFLEAASSVLFINVVDASVLVAFMAAGIGILDPPVDRGVAIVVGAAALALTGHLLYWRRGIGFWLPEGLRGWPIFKSFRDAPLTHYLKLASIRVPFDLCFVLNNWLALKAFGIEVPFLKVLVFVPLISFIAVVPVTVSGLGTVQAAMVYLFRPFAEEARILAFSLALTLALNGLRALLGLPFFRRVYEEILGKEKKEKRDAGG